MHDMVLADVPSCSELPLCNDCMLSAAMTTLSALPPPSSAMPGPGSSRDDDYFSLGDIIICLLDILLSVRDFWQVTIMIRLVSTTVPRTPGSPPASCWRSSTCS